MKRGFLNSSKAQKQLEQVNPPAPEAQAVRPRVSKGYRYGVVPEAELALPDDYKHLRLPNKEFHGSTMEYQSNEYIFTTVPPIPLGTKYSNFPGGYSECWISGHVKRAIYATPNFPTLPLPPTGGKAYRITDAGDKGLGMFATRLIHAGDLIIDERPLLVVPASNIAFEQAFGGIGYKYTLDQQVRIALHESNRYIEVAYNRLEPEQQKAFMALHNSHTQDGSGDFMGRVRTNGIGVDEKQLRDEGTTGKVSGRYSAICENISRLNHSCCPNTLFHWHTDSFSGRVYAVRDIPAGAEITLQYCDIMAPAAERAAALDHYGIKSCTCSPSCSDPARAKIAEERRGRFRKPVTATPPFNKPKHSTPNDVWVQPAIKRLRELEEEDLQASSDYIRTMHLLITAYVFLQDVDRVLFYAKKLDRVKKTYNTVDLDPLLLSRDGMKTSAIWKVVDELPKSMQKCSSGWLSFLDSCLTQNLPSRIMNYV